MFFSIANMYRLLLPIHLIPVFVSPSLESANILANSSCPLFDSPSCSSNFWFKELIIFGFKVIKVKLILSPRRFFIDWLNLFGWFWFMFVLI